jgi:hypothetical protein
MAGLRFLLGLIPETSKVEEADIKLRKDYEEFLAFENSDELKNYLELEKEVLSADFANRKKNILGQKFQGTEEHRKLTEFQSLEKSPAVKKYLKGGEGTDITEVKKYLELKEVVNSEKFRKVQEYMALSPKEKYKLSDEFGKETEYLDKKGSEKFQWYFKLKKKPPFGEIARWELTFMEAFNDGKLDTKHWMSRYLYGDKVLDKNYSLGDDKHAFTDGKNVEFYDGKLRLVTRREDAKSLVWNPTIGFYEKAFNFTSGLLSTGKSFSQKYGLIQAKVKLAPSGVTQAFTLESNTLLPHIDVFKFENNKLLAGNFWSDGGKEGSARSVSKTGGSRYTANFYIYSLEWAPGKLTWKINDVVFKVQTTGVPEEDMYLMFNSSLKEKSSEDGLPSAMEVGWVRVFKRKN